MRILFVGAHADDEVSAAGTLAKFKERGHEIYLTIFSFCEESSEALGHPKTILEKEFAHSIDALKIDPYHVFAHHYRVRHFPRFRQSILEDLVQLKKKIKPHLILTHNTMDIHQDHRTISEECRRGFKECMILGYESPGHTIFSNNNTCYVKLRWHHIEVKRECLHCYESQTVRPGMTKEVRESLARLRGAQIGHIYAEAFEVVRLYL